MVVVEGELNMTASKEGTCRRQLDLVLGRTSVCQTLEVSLFSQRKGRVRTPYTEETCT